MVAYAEVGPRSGIRTEAADEVLHFAGGAGEVYLAGLFEYLGCAESLGRNLFPGKNLVLRLGGNGFTGVHRVDDEVHSTCNQTGSEHHHAVVHGPHILVFADRHVLLQDEVAGVNLVLEEKRGDTGLFVAVDDRPVDWCGAAVLG